ncbi:MAG: rRNA maturation RNase YbeY [Verrucomicrobiaceae bacterium]|nr:rRNA maturation RNase YbeY [Verrucomicrobiaceae bacterium]
MPEIEIYAHHAVKWLDVEWLTDRAKAALPQCWALQKGESPALAELELVEISVVSDSAIAKVHGEFMDDPTPTDVITFHHGEILISAETAEKRGPEHGFQPQQELLLYVIHGLLHLAGWDDHEAVERSEMHQHQESVLKAVLAQ